MGRRMVSLGPDVLLKAHDKLSVSGSLDRLSEISVNRHLIIEEEEVSIDMLTSDRVDLVELELVPPAAMIGKTVEEIDFRNTYQINLLAITRNQITSSTNLKDRELKSGDILLIQGARYRLGILGNERGVILKPVDQIDVHVLQERLFALRIPDGSSLIGQSLFESRLGEAFGFSILGITRNGETILVPKAGELLQSGDNLLVEGNPENLDLILGLHLFEIDQIKTFDIKTLESEQFGLVEVTLSPNTVLAGKTLDQINFREKFSLSVLAIWREGQVYRSNLREMALKFGDSLLLHGSREKIKVLGSEPDFLVLTEAAQMPPRSKKAPIAALIMLLVILPVIFGWLPIVITALLGVVLMVLTGCLTMSEAYRSIEWEAIFIIAGMIPLGIALESVGAASLVANAMISTIGQYGPLVVTAGIFILASLASQFMPNAAVAVLLVPIAYNSAETLGISPYPLLMSVAVSASAAFLSPVGHPANLLIMGPGGYKFSDYYKVGLPLTIIVMIVFLIVVPIVWKY